MEMTQESVYAFCVKPKIKEF